MIATYEINKNLNGIEITFEGCPSESIRDMLKLNGYRWHRQKKIWYAKYSEWREKIAAMVCKDAEAETAPEIKSQAARAVKKPATNKYGVKVGDIFESSWGYEQTNVDFFQVVALAGKTSVRVREVRPMMINEEPTCSMAADRTYKIDGEMLPPLERSHWINDQERGDLKRLKSYSADGVSNPEFKLSSFASASLVKGDSVTTYESWYY